MSAQDATQQPGATPGSPPQNTALEPTSSGSPTPQQQPQAPAAPAPTIQPQQAQQILQTFLQSGFPIPQLQPDVVKHVTEYLSHDSDNKLTNSDHSGHRKLILRMTAIIIGAVLFLVLLSMPVIALIRGDVAFVNEFLNHHMPYLVGIVLAILGGAGIREMFKSS